MRCKARSTRTAVVTALALSALIVTRPEPVRAATPSLSIPIVGTVPTGGVFSGTLALNSFAVRNGQVVALGTVSGILTNATGAVASVFSNVAMPVSVTQSTCQILNLDIGPIALNLLGLQVNLNQVVLDVTSQAGSGNLLGNLLCGVAGLLDSPRGLSRLLNQILGILA